MKNQKVIPFPIKKDKVSELMVSGCFFLPIEDLGITEDEVKNEDFPDNLTDEQQRNLWGRIFSPYDYLTDLEKTHKKPSWMGGKAVIFDGNDPLPNSIWEFGIK